MLFYAFRLYRSCALLTLTCCYMMWAIVYLAQLHPIISEYPQGPLQP